MMHTLHTGHSFVFKQSTGSIQLAHEFIQTVAMFREYSCCRMLASTGQTCKWNTPELVN